MSKLTPPPSHNATVPVWLPALQRDFSSTLLESLSCDDKSFLVSPGSRDALAVQLRESTSVGTNTPSATLAERLELYQRQYWMRLFGALQESFARVAMHLGHFQFNRLALKHLRTQPPKSVDLADLAPEFGNFLRRELPQHTPSSVHTTQPSARSQNLLLQALAFDEAELKAFESPWSEPWRPSAEELALLPHRHLLIAPSFSLLREDWPLAERPENPHTSPPPVVHFPTARYWVYSRTQFSIALRSVEPAFARLLHAAQTQPLSRAVETLEQRLNESTRATLKEKLPQWTELALDQSWWLGVRDQPAALSDTKM